MCVCVRVCVCVNSYLMCVKLHTFLNYACCAVSKQFLSCTHWKILHLTGNFYTISGCDGCDKYEVCAKFANYLGVNILILILDLSKARYTVTVTITKAQIEILLLLSRRRRPKSSLSQSLKPFICQLLPRKGNNFASFLFHFPQIIAD